MAAARRTSRVPETAAESAMRDQEVVRANRELAAYFKGQRTEREARAALKIIKAFVRDREHADAKTRRPLPGLRAARASAGGGDKKTGRAKPRTPHKVRTRRVGRPPGPDHVVAPDEALPATPPADE